MLSATCRDFLCGLLQRDPSKRISFETFLNHPFVDLEHLANEKSLPKAVIEYFQSLIILK